jgi:hypothetical protein
VGQVAEQQWLPGWLEFLQDLDGAGGGMSGDPGGGCSGGVGFALECEAGQFPAVGLAVGWPSRRPRVRMGSQVWSVTPTFAAAASGQSRGSWRERE